MQVYGSTISYDDVSNHDFIFERLARKLNLTTIRSSFAVKSAFQSTRYNGISMVTDLPITIGAYTQKRSFLVAPLHSTDLILGIPFCHEHNLDHTHTDEISF